MTEEQRKALAEARATSQAEREATLNWANSHYRNLMQTKLVYRAKKDEIATLHALGAIADAAAESP